MPVDPGRPVDGPVRRQLFLKPAFVTDPVFYLTPFIFPGCHTEYFITPVPQRHLAITFRMITITMRVYRFQEPDPILEPERLIRQRTHRAYVDDIADKVV